MATEATQRTRRAGFMSEGEAPTAIWADRFDCKNLLGDVWVTVSLPPFVRVWQRVSEMFATRHAPVAPRREGRTVMTRFGLVTAALAAVISYGSAARAFCRTVTEKPPLGYDPQSGCFTGSADSKLLYWKNQCVGYSLKNTASSKVTLEQASKIVADAFATWSAAA